MDLASLPIDHAFFTHWLREHMPLAFCQEVSQQERELLASALLALNWQEGFATLESTDKAFGIALNHEKADQLLLERCKTHQIRDYHTFLSLAPLSFLGCHHPLRIIILYFLDSASHAKAIQTRISSEATTQLQLGLHATYKDLTLTSLNQLLSEINPSFLELLMSQKEEDASTSTSAASLLLVTKAVELLLRERLDNFNPVEAIYEEAWSNLQRPSLQILLTVSHTNLTSFLHQLTHFLSRKPLLLCALQATHITPYSSENRLLILINLHGKKQNAAWEENSIPQLLQELGRLRLIEEGGLIERSWVDTATIQSFQASFFQAAALLCHQLLGSFDSEGYTLARCEEALCRYSELSSQLVRLFEKRFHPHKNQAESYLKLKEETLQAIEKLDSGQLIADTRRRHILKFTVDWIDCTLKTNFWCLNQLGLSFRLAPELLDRLPFDRLEKFPELPFALFFHLGVTSQGKEETTLQTFGFHLRFRDLARGGLRTIICKSDETYHYEATQLFSEAYNLAYTQQTKNKDLPEGGAKAVILLAPYAIAFKEREALRLALRANKTEEQLNELEKARKNSYLHFCQKAFIQSLMTLINCDDSGHLKEPLIVDYWKKPEYLFLGPDENMHNEMLIWIEQYSRRAHYRPGGAFISSHPIYGINHKEYGVTSLGLHLFVKEGLKALKIDPATDIFTLKMSGGPDGDVAGNELANLAREFPHTARLLALTDGSGTIFEPEGLDWPTLLQLFTEEKAIAHYPPSLLSKGGLLLDRTQNKVANGSDWTSLCWRHLDSGLSQSWISSSESESIYRLMMHATPVDLFIPAGGRPHTLEMTHIDQFMHQGKPSARLIVEGANLYLTPNAREYLEERGTLIFRDSSANKGGVMSSSFEVLLRLCLSPEELLEHKEGLIREVLGIIAVKSQAEARLLLRERLQSGKKMTHLSKELSEKINLFSDALRSALIDRKLTVDEESLFQRVIENYAPPLLRNSFAARFKEKLPLSYQVALVSTHIACQLVYQRGLAWQPSARSEWPLLLSDASLTAPFTLLTSE